ncbi:MAG TPA: sodium-dependent transporter [Pseudomonadaceae bacterium]|nr:sodium-dependent transporter [Pseudomonadaceae bacterium]
MSALRGQFSSRFGFVMAAAGSAVGIGNLVGFPVMASKNGGAAFLFVYLLCIVFICFPIMMAEVAMGRAAQSSPVGAFGSLANGSRFWRKVGGLAIVTPFMISVFYTVITVWIGIYALQSLLGNLDQLARPEAFGEIVSSPSIFVYAVPLMALVFFILAGGVKDGIERSVRILMPALILLLVLLVAFVLTLDNALAGLRFFLVPDFSKISSGVINAAVNHGFFSLSLGMGIMITYGSYLNRRESIVNSAGTACGLDTVISIFAGLLLIPAVFAVNPLVQGSELTDSSIGMMFSYMPSVLLSLQDYVGYFGASVVASLFFLLIFFAALTSLVSITEIPIAWFIDEKRVPRRAAIGWLVILQGVFVVMAILSFGISGFFTQFVHYGGMDKSFFDLILDVFYETILPLIGFTVCLFCCYRWRLHAMSREIAQGAPGFEGSLLQRYLALTLGTLIPVMLLAVFASNVSRLYFSHNLFGF